MKRFRVALGFLLLSGCGGGSAPRPAPLDLPMLGGTPLSEADRAANDAMVAAGVAELGSRAEAGKAWRLKAWQALERRDPAAAMHDFNRAWLCDPEHAEVYWGFGVLEGMQGHAAQARDLFERGLTKDPGHDGIRAGLAQACCDLAHDTGPATPEGKALLDRAEALCRALEAEGIERDQPYWTWAFVLAAREDWAGAWGKVHRAQALGGGSRHPRFLQMLSEKLPDPG